MKHVDEPYLQPAAVLAQNRHRSQRLGRRNISRAGDNRIRLLSGVGAPQFVDQAGAELFEGELGIVPVALALAAAGEPDFADEAGLEDVVLVGVDDTDVEAGGRGSAADDLGGGAISETSVVMRALPRARACSLTEMMERPPSETARVFSASPYAA